MFILKYACLIVFLYSLLKSAQSSCNGGDCLDAKLEEILNKIGRVERRLNHFVATSNRDSCTRICKDDWTDLEKRITTTTTSNTIKCPQNPRKFCKDSGVTEVDLIQFNPKKSIKLLCVDKWITILQRLDGTVPFNMKSWKQYAEGFGQVSANTEFFLGLQNLHDITATEPYELRIELEDFKGEKRTADYSEFSVGDEQSAFKLGALGSYSGDAGDSFKYHEGQSFSSLDRDNDAKSIGSCAEEFNSAGWFKSCMEANLMGRYLRGENEQFKEGMYWETFHGPEYSLKSVKMLIRAKC